jgi:hypothetical protein
MAELTITCPSCNADIPLTDSLARPLIESKTRDFERKMAAKDAEVAKREEDFRLKEAQLAQARETLEEQVQSRLQTERSQIAAEEAKKARALLANDLERKSREVTDLKEVLQTREAKLAEALQAQAELVRKERQLEDAKREMDLTIENRVQASLQDVRTKARAEAEDGLKLKVAEREQRISSMQRQIEELKRKAEQGSQQLQGEVLELELESLLRSKFPRDTIEPVPKGEHGGDVLQRVYSQAGQLCGTILWETKRTKAWSDSWLGKLRSDQRAAQADLAIIVSQVVPAGIELFDLSDGIWIAKPACVIPIALALRAALNDLAMARAANTGQQTKQEMMYAYLTGPRFKHRVEAILEGFSTMQADLEKERRTMTKAWAKREEQIRGVVAATVGMYGDLQGIAGKTMLEIEGLEVPELPEPGESG